MKKCADKIIINFYWVSKQKVEMESVNEEMILRRVFGLCFLNTIEYASFRQALNPDRSSDTLSAKDYTVTDYNYVSIKRKTFALIMQAIIDQPGPVLTPQLIRDACQRWLKESEEDGVLDSYCFDSHQVRLIRDSTIVARKIERVLLEDVCPRTGNPRVSFSIAFLKARLPDLMGDSKVESLV